MTADLVFDPTLACCRVRYPGFALSLMAVSADRSADRTYF